MQTTGNLGLKKPEGTDIVDIADLNGNMDILDNAVNGKVDKVTGKQLSSNDYTAAEKTKLAGIVAGANNYAHPNHTGDVTSTGDGVTAIAAGVIVDADVNSAAGIGWTKISKTGSSLADLATKSATDLSSGTLLAARMPAISGDITIAIGTTSAVITAGAIINADVNAAAAIDASKIATGVVSNAEFGYLDGVTSAIQPQINAKATLSTTPQQTRADITYYVRTDGNDANTGLGNAAGTAFKTIGKAISMIPQMVNHTATINVAAGTYAEAVVFAGFLTTQDLSVIGSGVVSVTSVEVNNCQGIINVTGLTATTTTKDAFKASASRRVVFTSCIATAVASTFTAFWAGSSDVFVNSCTMSNHGNGIAALAESVVYASGNTGVNNGDAYFSVFASYLGYSGSVPVGAMTTSDGGTLVPTRGVLNPWGDNTTDQRTGVMAGKGVAQSISASTWTKIAFPATTRDYLLEFNKTTAVFTAKKNGVYLINASVLCDSVPAGFSAQMRIFLNGSQSTVLGESLTQIATSITCSGACILFLSAGEILELYLITSSATSVNLANDVTFFGITRIS